MEGGCSGSGVSSSQVDGLRTSRRTITYLPIAASESESESGDDAWLGLSSFLLEVLAAAEADDVDAVVLLEVLAAAKAEGTVTPGRTTTVPVAVRIKPISS